MSIDKMKHICSIVLSLETVSDGKMNQTKLRKLRKLAREFHSKKLSKYTTLQMLQNLVSLSQQVRCFSLEQGTWTLFSPKVVGTRPSRGVERLERGVGASWWKLHGRQQRTHKGIRQIFHKAISEKCLLIFNDLFGKQNQFTDI